MANGTDSKYYYEYFCLAGITYVMIFFKQFISTYPLKWRKNSVAKHIVYNAAFFLVLVFASSSC